MLLNRDVRERCVDLLSAEPYDRVVREACVILEHRVRQAIAGESQVFGTTLMEQAFDPKEGRLRMSSSETEQRGVLYIFLGVMHFFRNPSGHQLMKSTDTQHDAWCFVLWIDFLLTLLSKAEMVRGGAQDICSHPTVLTQETTVSEKGVVEKAQRVKA